MCEMKCFLNLYIRAAFSDCPAKTAIWTKLQKVRIIRRRKNCDLLLSVKLIKCSVLVY